MMYIKFLGILCSLFICLSKGVYAEAIHHYAYFARDREQINHPQFLKSTRFEGAQIMYAWDQLEPEQGVYNFQEIHEDLKFLKTHNKKLFIQLQDATFSPQRKSVPQYLLNSPQYQGGVAPQFDEQGVLQGWVARRWDPLVQERLAHLYCALAKAFDGQIAGINLQETAIEVTHKDKPIPQGFTPSTYRDSILINMKALKTCFSKSLVMQYANFMPGEWLPEDDQGFLKSVYRFASSHAIAIGSPDLMPQRKGQQNHAYSLMNKGNNTFGIAVQDGNYFGKTGNPELPQASKNLVPQLFKYAQEHLKVSYIFWVIQEPYFSRDVVPFLDKQ